MALLKIHSIKCLVIITHASCRKKNSTHSPMNGHDEKSKKHRLAAIPSNPFHIQIVEVSTDKTHFRTLHCHDICMYLFYQCKCKSDYYLPFVRFIATKTFSLRPLTYCCSLVCGFKCQVEHF